MGNSKSAPATEMTPEAEKIMLEVLSGQTADGDVFPSSRELKKIKQEKKNPARLSRGDDNFIRRSRLVGAYKNTRLVNNCSGGKQRRATVKECWAEALASRRTKELQQTISTPIPTATATANPNPRNKAGKKVQARRRDTMLPPHLMTAAA